MGHPAGRRRARGLVHRRRLRPLRRLVVPDPMCRSAALNDQPRRLAEKQSSAPRCGLCSAPGDVRSLHSVVRPRGSSLPVQ